MLSRLFHVDLTVKRKQKSVIKVHIYFLDIALCHAKNLNSKPEINHSSLKVLLIGTV